MNWFMPGVREQQPRLGRRDQRRGPDARVTALLEERQERLADAAAFHGGSLPAVRRRPAARFAGKVVVGAQLGLALGHRLPALLDRLGRPASRGRADRPWPRGPAWRRDALRLLLGPPLARMAPVAPAPSADASQNPRFTSCGHLLAFANPSGSPRRS